MKRRTFYHLSLLIPYLVLIVSGAVTYFINGMKIFDYAPGPSPNIFVGVVTIFTFAGIIWGPLYTWMVIVMLIWGRKRSTDDIRRLYMFSPVLLACSMGIPVLAMEPTASGEFLLEGILRMNNLGFAVPVLLKDTDPEMSFTIGIAWLFMAAICILFGYMFVGIVVWLEGMLKKRGRFREETEGQITNPS